MAATVLPPRAWRHLCAIAVLSPLVTVAVAWVCALVIDVSATPPDDAYGTSARLGDRDIAWTTVMFCRTGACRGTVWYEFEEPSSSPRSADIWPNRAASAVKALDLDIAPSEMVDGSADALCVLSAGAGWPWLALRHDLWRVAIGPNDGPKRWLASAAPGIALGLPPFSPVAAIRPVQFGDLADPGTRTLPLRPLWPGFIFNSTATAVLAAAALVGVPAAIRLQRARHGRCLDCGYQRSQGVRCAECGNA